MKRRMILISAIFLIGVVGAIALTQLLSNTAQFQVWVDSNSAMKIDVMNQPSGPLYQTHWYPDAIELNVSNKDVNQGYNFALVVTILAVGLDSSMLNMKISYSSGDQSNYVTPIPVAFTNLDGGNGVNTSFVPATPGYFHVDAVDGGSWAIYYLISFQFDGAPSGQSYTFQFEAWDGVGP